MPCCFVMRCLAIHMSQPTRTTTTPAGGTSPSGQGKPIDTELYFVICPNVLGGCRGTTGPNSFNPETGKPYGADFPVITIGDVVEVQRRLVDHLGIDRLLAVVGGSLGGHMALTWASRHSDRLLGVAPIATSAAPDQSGPRFRYRGTQLRSFATPTTEAGSTTSPGNLPTLASPSPECSAISRTSPAKA